jgi:hypothetical protein
MNGTVAVREGRAAVSRTLARLRVAAIDVAQALVGAVSSVGRASALHAECRRFESVTAHQPLLAQRRLPRCSLSSGEEQLHPLASARRAERAEAFLLRTNTMCRKRQCVIALTPIAARVFVGDSKKLARGLAIESGCDGARAVSGARRIRVANPPTANDQIASLSSLEARKATFLLALI